MKKLILPAFYFLSIVYFEMIFHYFCFGNFKIASILLFSLPFIAVFYFLCKIFNEKTQKIYTYILLSILAFIFIAQFIYYQIYNSMFTFKAVALAGQAATAFDKPLEMLLNNWYVLILNLLPIVLFIIFNKKIIFKRFDIKSFLITLVPVLLIILSPLLFLKINNNGLYSNYNLYYKIQQPVLTTSNMGLLTQMKLDIYRNIVGFKENITLNSTNFAVKEEIKYNTTDIDFDKVIENTTNEDLNMLNNYISTKEPTEQNEYTGLFKGKNLILILAESLDKVAIDEELTPNLYKLLGESIHFNNYYTPLFPTSTGDGEYMTEWGILANPNNQTNLYTSRNNNNPFLLHNVFQNLNYETSIYHNYKGWFYSRNKYFAAQNYDNIKFCEDGIVSSCEKFRASDLEMFQNTIDDYVSNESFFTYYITVSGHGNYYYNDNAISRKNYSQVKDLPYSSKLKTFLAANIELDKAIGYLLEQLELNNQLENTVIAITPDHYPYYMDAELLNEKSIYDRTDKFEKHHEDLIVWTPNLEDITVDKYISNVDILPTLLNLFGVEYDSRLFIGEDAFSKKGGIVMLSDQSWITKEGSYDATTSEIKGTITQEYVDEINQIVNNNFKISSLIQSTNYYTYLYDKIYDINNPIVEENETP